MTYCDAHFLIFFQELKKVPLDTLQFAIISKTTRRFRRFPVTHSRLHAYFGEIVVPDVFLLRSTYKGFTRREPSNDCWIPITHLCIPVGELGL